MCHHNKHQMRHFEFLCGSAMIRLSLNILEKLHWQHIFEKYILRTTSTNGDHHHYDDFFFLFGHQSCTWPVLAHSVNKTHILVVTGELIWLLFLNILSFNFAPQPNKPFRLTRFERSYVNRPAIVLTNHCQSYTSFLLDVRCSKWSSFFLFFSFFFFFFFFFFLQLFVPNHSSFA